jgi:hypothetical protein
MNKQDMILAKKALAARQVKTEHKVRHAQSTLNVDEQSFTLSTWFAVYRDYHEAERNERIKV